MKKLSFYFGSLLVILFLTNCASIVSKTTYPIHVGSAPDGANVIITDKKGQQVYAGVTPTTALLSTRGGYFTKATYFLKFSKEGYSDQTTMLTCDINGWYFGNLVFGGLIGLLIVDPATGAMFKFKQETVAVTLKLLTASSDKRSLEIHSIEEVPTELRSSLIRIN